MKVGCRRMPHGSERIRDVMSSRRGQQWLKRFWRGRGCSPFPPALSAGRKAVRLLCMVRAHSSLPTCAPCMSLGCQTIWQISYNVLGLFQASVLQGFYYRQVSWYRVDLLWHIPVHFGLFFG